MKELIINQIVIPFLLMGIGTILEIARRQLKTYLDSKKELIEKQKEALQQSMGIEQYNKDVSTVKGIVKTVEQLGKEFNWNKEMKNSKVLEMIENKTSLSDEEIYNIIKATVLEVNNLNANANVLKTPTVQSTISK